MWRELVSQNIQLDAQRRASNPVVANFSTLVNTAMQLGMRNKEAAVAEERANRTAARTAVYSKYPQLAAQDLGLDVPPAQALPSGFVPSRAVMDESGQIQTTFEPPRTTTIPTPPAGFNPIRTTIDESGNMSTVYEPPSTSGTKPSWGQEQKIQALSTGLRMGKVVIGREFGEPSVYEVKDMESALSAIQDAGLDPALFAQELKLYDVVEERIIKVGKQKKIMQKLRDGRIIWADTKELVE